MTVTFSSLPNRLAGCFLHGREPGHSRRGTSPSRVPTRGRCARASPRGSAPTHRPPPRASFFLQLIPFTGTQEGRNQLHSQEESRPINWEMRCEICSQGGRCTRVNDMVRSPGPSVLLSAPAFFLWLWFWKTGGLPRRLLRIIKTINFLIHTLQPTRSCTSCSDLGGPGSFWRMLEKRPVAHNTSGEGAAEGLLGSRTRRTLTPTAQSPHQTCPCPSAHGTPATLELRAPHLPWRSCFSHFRQGPDLNQGSQTLSTPHPFTP